MRVYTPVSELIAKFQQANGRMIRLILKIAVKLRPSERKKEILWIREFLWI